MDISIIIPTYNEKDNVLKIIEGIEKLGLGSYEMIFVDDSSPDGTGEIIREQSAKKSHIRLISRPGKQGLSSAYFRGMKEARGTFIVTMEADFLDGVRYVPRILEEMKRGSEFVLCSRYIRGGGSEINMIKRLGSRILNVIACAYLGLPMKDITFALRGTSRDLFMKIADRMSFWGHPDFLVQLNYLSYRVQVAGFGEVPVFFTRRVAGESKIKMLVPAFRFLFLLGRIRRSF